MQVESRIQEIQTGKLSLCKDLNNLGQESKKEANKMFNLVNA